MENNQPMRQILDEADLIHTSQEIEQALQRMAVDITQNLGHQQPLVLCVMTGAVVFAGQLLPQLHFPLDFDYVHLTRYGNALQGGEIQWRAAPRESFRNRVVLVLDDILDEGMTLAAIRNLVMEHGAQAFYSAVLVEKNTGRAKPVKADFVGLPVPDRYVFGFGMDVRGKWRNLPAIYALRE